MTPSLCLNVSLTRVPGLTIECFTGARVCPSLCSGFFLNFNWICVRANVSGRECLLLFSVLYISSGSPEWREVSLAPQVSSCHTPHPSLIVFNQQFLQPHAFCTLFSLDTGHQQLSMALRWLLVTHLGHLERFGQWLWPLVGGKWLTAPSMLQFTNYLGISPLTAQRLGPAPCCRSLWGGARGTRRRSPSTWSPGTWSQRLWRLLWRLTEAQYPCSLSDTDIRAFSPLTTDHTALSLLSRQNHSGVRTHWNRSHRPLKTTG